MYILEGVLIDVIWGNKYKYRNKKGERIKRKGREGEG
jgi:hypothetical protein